MASVEGVVLAEISLILIAISAIVLGALQSVQHLKEEQGSEKPGDPVTIMKAITLPFEIGAVLLLLYFRIKLQDTMSDDATAYLDGPMFGLLLMLLGVVPLSYILSPLISPLASVIIRNTPYHLRLTMGSEEAERHVIGRQFKTHDVTSLVICFIVGLWYIYTENWILNNLFGFALSVNAIKEIFLNQMIVVNILLCDLLIYDVLMVFLWDIMVTVVAGIRGPLLIKFPVDLLEKGVSADRFGMLGLGDIIIPGLFIAFLLRFDRSLCRKYNFYFYTSLGAYVVGLLVTTYVVVKYQHAQPALLYLVPACLVTTVVSAFIKGDLKLLFQYRDYPEMSDQIEQQPNSSDNSTTAQNAPLKANKND